jgi:hypothetical protein
MTDEGKYETPPSPYGENDIYYLAGQPQNRRNYSLSNLGCLTLTLAVPLYLTAAVLEAVGLLDKDWDLPGD